MAENSRYWHQSEKNKAHERVVSAVRFLDDQFNSVRLLNERHLRLYGNRNIAGLGPNQYSKSSGNQPQLRLNLVKSVIDTNVAEHVGNKPKPMYLTLGGDWSLKARGKKLGKFVQGIFYQEKLYSRLSEFDRDSGIFGTGVAKIHGEGDRINIERVLCDDLLVDDAEARMGNPQQLFHIMTIAKDVAKSKWPKFKREIDAASMLRSRHSIGSRTDAISELIQVVEAWWLPSAPEAEDGRHVICIEGATFLDEPWTRDHFPFAFVRRTKQPLGFWGYGLAEELTPSQVEVNDILEYMESVIRYHAPHILIPRGAKVSKSQIDNVAWSIIEYAGDVKPEWLVPNMFPGELINHLERRIRNAYESTGTNILFAQANRPVSLNSGKAINAFNDTGSRRAIEYGDARQQFVMEIADLVVECAKEVDAKLKENYEETGEGQNGLRVLSPGRRDLNEISWDDVDMRRDQYQMQAYPISIFSTSPVEKWNQIQEMKMNGDLTREEADLLMDWPDIEAVTGRRNAPFENIMKQVENIIEHGQPAEVEEFDNLQLVLQIIPLEIQLAKRDGVPEDRIELLRRYFLDAHATLANAVGAPVPVVAPEDMGVAPSATQQGTESAGVPPPMPDIDYKRNL